MKKLLLCFLLLSLCFAAQSQDTLQLPKKNLGITFSFPWVNYYRYTDFYKNGNARKFGFFGLGFSTYYKNGPDKISFNCSTSEDLDSPSAAINYSKKDISTSISTSVFELAWYRKIHEDFGWVAGINFSNYIFHLASKVDSVSSYRRSVQTLGASLGIEYRFNKYYSVAGMYRPALASFETDRKYRHVINFELRIDLDFKNR